MATDYNPFYIMDADLERRVHEAILFAIEMAKASYPHLSKDLQATEELYRQRLQSFIGSHNKPITTNAYSTKDNK